jgi:hypothetical protein
VIVPACKVGTRNLSTPSIQSPAEFPRKPIGVLRDHLTAEANNRLGCYLPIPDSDQPPDPNLPPPPERPKLPEDVVDAPLVRIYNFLRNCFPYIFRHCGDLTGL